jgi:hypothetical protein
MRTAVIAALLTPALAAPAAAAPQLVNVGHFDNPIYAASPPRDTTRLFVVQRGGVIRVVRDGTVLPTPFLDLSGQIATDGERGLLSIAFPFDYAASGRFYVYLAAASPPGELQIREYGRSAADPDVANPARERIVWRAAHDQADNHNGGTIAFGPDGMLWLGTGDGGGGNDEFHNAQNLASRLGKLIRIDPDPSPGRTYTVPSDNPYASTPAEETVWARGLRNPFRWSFDGVTGDLVIGDVGQDAREEVDWLRRSAGLGRGADLGWACREGFSAGPTPADCIGGVTFTDPVFDYSQASPRAITGGVVVRDPGLPTLAGRYLYADSYTGDLRSLVLGTPRATGDRAVGLHRDQVVAFAEDACGHVYVVSLTGGTVDRLQDGAIGPCVLRPAPAPPVRPGAPRDTLPCKVTMRVTGARRFARRHRLRTALRSDEACRVTVGGRVRGVAGFHGGARRSLAAGRRRVLALRLTRHGVRRLRRAFRHHRTLRVTLRVRTVDAAGNRGGFTRRLRVRRG